MQVNGLITKQLILKKHFILSTTNIVNSNITSICVENLSKSPLIKFRYLQDYKFIVQLKYNLKFSYGSNIYMEHLVKLPSFHKDQPLAFFVLKSSN